MGAKGTWWHRIEQAEARGHFTQQDREDARQWTTCACGEQDERIPRRHLDTRMITHPREMPSGIGYPLDDRLLMLGIVFPRYVSEDRFDEAREVLHRIERNAERVLRKYSGIRGAIRRAHVQRYPHKATKPMRAAIWKFVGGLGRLPKLNTRSVIKVPVGQLEGHRASIADDAGSSPAGDARQGTRGVALVAKPGS